MSNRGAASPDPALIAQSAMPTVGVLQPHVLEWMFISFAQDAQLFAEARLVIFPQHFHANELPLRLIYEAMCVSMDAHGGMTYDTLSYYVDQILQNDPSLLLPPDDLNILFRRDEEGLIQQICHPTNVEMNETNRSYAKRLVQQFGYERTIVEPLRKAAFAGGSLSVIPEDLTEFLDSVARQNSLLSTMQHVPVVDMVPTIGAPLQASSTFKLTGVPFIDEVLGGQRDGDANGILGPTGGGKTTLAVYMAVSTARQCWLEAQQTGTEPECVAFITVEEAATKLRPRIWSSFFMIPRQKLDTLQDWGMLTQPGQLDEYELRAQQGQPYPLSETERYQAYSAQLQQCFVTLDLSGSEDNPHAGNGFIPEIVSYLDQLSRSGRRFRSVYIDYAGLLCERWMQSQNMDEKNYRYLLKTFGDRCRKEISERFRCTTWILHQLKGEVGAMAPTKLMRHTDAAESKDIAVNMAVCGCLGVPDPLTGCRRLNWSKVRYRPNEQIAPATLRINQFAEMEDVTQQYVVGETGQFVTREEQETLQGLARTRNAQVGGPAGLRSADLSPSDRADL